MATQTYDWEQRSAKREIVSGPVWWYRHDKDAEIHTGHFFDESRSGVSFMTSRDYTLNVGDKLDLTSNDPRCGDTEFETVRVVRVEHMTSDSQMICCTRFP